MTFHCNVKTLQILTTFALEEIEFECSINYANEFSFEKIKGIKGCSPACHKLVLFQQEY